VPPVFLKAEVTLVREKVALSKVAAGGGGAGSAGVAVRMIGTTTISEAVIVNPRVEARSFFSKNLILIWLPLSLTHLF
jgi:hypothetical protein